MDKSDKVTARTFWDSEEVFFSGDEYFARMLKDINTAQEYISVEMYIFNDDRLGQEVAEALIAAHQRGVKVQVLVDGVGSYHFYGKLHHLFDQAGVVVKIYNPLPFLHPFYGKLTLTRKFEVFFARALRLNQRNHRKIVTMDHEIMYAGSFNITAEHTRYHPQTWKDMGVRVTGKAVRYAVLNFKRGWRLRDYYRFRKQIKKLPKANWRSSPLRLGHNVLRRRHFYLDFVGRIRHAQQRVWFTSPYFIPKGRVIKALGKAAERGVDVRLLLAAKSDVFLFRTLQFFYYPYLIKAGVKIFSYTGAVLHAKSYIIDDWMTIGSSNLNHRSMIHDMEVDLVIQDEENKKRIEEHFLQSCGQQQLVTLEQITQLPMADRFLSRIYFIFRYWF